jgi:hypothetical protein
MEKKVNLEMLERARRMIRDSFANQTNTVWPPYWSVYD